MCEAVVTCHRPSGQETDDTSTSRRLHNYDTDTIMGLTSFLACLPAQHQAPGLICNIIVTFWVCGADCNYQNQMGTKLPW